MAQQSHPHASIPLPSAAPQAAPSSQDPKAAQRAAQGNMMMMPQQPAAQFSGAPVNNDAGDSKYFPQQDAFGAQGSQGQAADADGDDANFSGRVLRISATSQPKNVAGAVAHISRQGECPGMLATGSASINQAIKAVAIARGYLDDNKLELSCYPEFRQDKRTGLKLTLVKSVRRDGAADGDKDVQQLKVSKNSNPNSVAGAIANKVRGKQRVWLLAIGADSVTHAVKAIAIGRKYLERDNIDISFRPEFTKVRFEDGRDCSAVKFIILSQDV